MLAFSIAEAFVDQDSIRIPSPVMSWRNDRKHSIVLGLLVGVVTGVLSGVLACILYGIASGPVAGVNLGSQWGIIMALVTWPIVGIGISRRWTTALASAQLSRRWHTPLNLMKFLDDAHRRNILRTVGPVYQFRHARLQDRLAAVAKENFKG